MEKYSRGGRGAPAKGVGRSHGARVQIPPSPLHSELHHTVFFYAQKSLITLLSFGFRIGNLFYKTVGRREFVEK